MKRQNTKKSLANFKSEYVHLIIKSSKFIYGGTHCGLSDGQTDGATDGLADGSVAGYDAGYDDGYDAGTMGG